MAIRLNIRATNVDAQIARTTRFGFFAETEYKIAMRQILAPVKADVKAGAPVFTGALQKEIWSKVSGTGANVTGRVANGDNTWYGNVIEFGRHKTRKQPPVGVIAEKYGVPFSEAFVIARAIAAKDARARIPVGYFAKARAKAYQLAMNGIYQANERIVAKMAAK